MLRLTLALGLITLTSFWLVFRRLHDLPLTIKVITLGTLAVLFFRPFISGDIFFPADLIFQGIIICLAFALILYKLSTPTAATLIFGPDKMFFIFLIIICFTFLGSVNKQSTLNQIIYFLTLYLWYWIIINLPVHNRFPKIIFTTIILAAILIIIYAIYQYKSGFTAMREFVIEHPQYLIQSRDYLRRFKSNAVFSTFLYPPALAGYLNVVFFAILGLTLAESNKGDGKIFSAIKSCAYYLLLLTIILVMILTKSKGGWLSLFAGLVIFTSLSGKGRGVAKKIIIFFLAFVIFFVAIGFSKKIILPKPRNVIASLKVRQEYWKAAAQMIKEKPLLGYGAGTFGSVYPAFKTKLAEETKMAHNSYLQLWAETGIFGLMAFLLFWLKFIANGYQEIKKESSEKKIIKLGLYTAILSFLIHNLVDFDLYLGQISTVVFALIGIFIWTSSRENSKLKAELKPNKRARQFLLFFSSVLFIFLMSYITCVLIARFHNEKARQAFYQNNLEKALKFLEKASALDRLSAQYRFQQAVIYERMLCRKQTTSDLKHLYIEKAIFYYKKAITLEPYMPYYHFRLGRFLFLTGKSAYFGEGLAQIKKASVLYPAKPFYHEQLSHFYDIIGEPESAEKEKAIAKELDKYYIQGTR